MPTYTEVIEHENNALPNIIRLVTSEQFYRAYNRSAWLFNTCIVSYKVIRKYVKAIQNDIRYIGFPISSVENILKNRALVTTEYGVDIILFEMEEKGSDCTE